MFTKSARFTRTFGQSRRFRLRNFKAHCLKNFNILQREKEQKRATVSFEILIRK